MKKILVCLAVAAFLTGCGPNIQISTGDISDVPTVIQNGEVITEPTATSDDGRIRTKADLEALSSDAEVKVIGKKQNSGVANGNQIMATGQLDNGETVIYYCQLKADFVETAEEIRTGNIVEIDGIFESWSEIDVEGTSPIVNLYDCEIKVR